MKKIVSVLLLLLVLMLVLALTYPDNDSFYRHIAQVSAPRDASNLDKLRGKALQAQARLTTRYADHRLWATAEALQGSQRESYLGILGFWVELP